MTIQDRKNSVTLSQLEFAIVKHCQVDNEAEKPLILVKQSSHKSVGIARSLFIFFANHFGYSKDEICGFLDMTDQEYFSKQAHLQSQYAQGREDFFAMSGQEYRRSDIENPNLFFYRKYQLICNFIKLAYGQLV